MVGFCLLTFAKGYANDITIRIKMEGLTYDTIWFGKTLGRKPYPQQFDLKNEDGTYEIRVKGPVKPGFYAIFFKTSSMGRLNYFHVAIDKVHGNFSVSGTLAQILVTVAF